MHTEAMPRQFKVVVSKEEMQLIIVALGYAGSVNNNLWATETREKVLAIRAQMENTLKGS